MIPVEFPTNIAPHAAGVHPYITVHNIIIPGSAEWTFYGRPMGTYNALVDLMGHKDLGAKTLSSWSRDFISTNGRRLDFLE